MASKVREKVIQKVESLGLTFDKAQPSNSGGEYLYFNYGAKKNIPELKKQLAAFFINDLGFTKTGYVSSYTGNLNVAYASLEDGNYYEVAGKSFSNDEFFAIRYYSLRGTTIETKLKKLAQPPKEAKPPKVHTTSLRILQKVMQRNYPFDEQVMEILRREEFAKEAAGFKWNDCWSLSIRDHRQALKAVIEAMGRQRPPRLAYGGYMWRTLALYKLGGKIFILLNEFGETTLITDASPEELWNLLFKEDAAPQDESTKPSLKDTIREGLKK